MAPLTLPRRLGPDEHQILQLAQSPQLVVRVLERVDNRLCRPQGKALSFYSSSGDRDICALLHLYPPRARVVLTHPCLKLNTDPQRLQPRRPGLRADRVRVDGVSPRVQEVELLARLEDVQDTRDKIIVVVGCVPAPVPPRIRMPHIQARQGPERPVCKAREERCRKHDAVASLHGLDILRQQHVVQGSHKHLVVVAAHAAGQVHSPEQRALSREALHELLQLSIPD